MRFANEFSDPNMNRNFVVESCARFESEEILQEFIE